MLVAVLLFGTQMPGAWRDVAVAATRMPWQFTKVAHCVLSARMACLARVPPLRWSLVRVGVDLAGAGAGAVVGVVLARVGRARYDSRSSELPRSLK